MTKSLKTTNPEQTIKSFLGTLMDSMRLTRGCKAGMLLLAKLRSGELSGTEKPKAVHISDAEFQKYSLTKFRTFYNRLKKDLGSSKTGEWASFIPKLIQCAIF